MHITCVMVSSLDGKTTEGDNSSIHSWTSEEDKKHFSELIDMADCIIMGRHTYEAAKDMMTHKPGRLRVVLTHNPEHYTNRAIHDQLEFTSSSPSHLVSRLKKRSFRNVLLLGGATTNKTFLETDLIDELFLTIEPVLLGKGNSLFAEGTQTKTMKLQSVKKLNEKGTLLFTYYFHQTS